MLPFRADKSVPPHRPRMIRKYEYLRRLPHYQKSDRALFTFCELNWELFSDPARDLVLQHPIRRRASSREASAADMDHSSGGGDEIRFADVVTLFFSLNYIANELFQLFIRRSAAHQAIEVMVPD